MPSRRATWILAVMALLVGASPVLALPAPARPIIDAVIEYGDEWDEPWQGTRALPAFVMLPSSHPVGTLACALWVHDLELPLSRPPLRSFATHGLGSGPSSPSVSER
jgi:hypothetical protein